MATITPAIIRNEIVDNIKDIALDPTPSGLGLLDQASVNDSLLEWTKDELKSKYLSANIDTGKKQVRAFGVEVTHTITPFTQGVHEFTFNAEIELYYETGYVNEMIDAYHSICLAILNGQVPCLLDILDSISTLSIVKIPAEGKEQEILRGTFVVEGRKTQAST